MQADLSPLQRREQIETLYRRHALRRGRASLQARGLRFVWKKFVWRTAVGGAVLFKRLIDIAVSFLALVLLSPLFLLIALAIKATDGGPILFRQTRVGKWGREFSFPKFRSMVVNAEQLKETLLAQNDHAVKSSEGSAAETQVTFKMKRDPRITWIGRIIRKLSLDETPQLWCVLIGQMSLVGPRPPLPREVAKYTLADRRRLDVVPGLTCLWQINGRGDIPFPQQVALDVQYIESRNLWLDVVILLRTVPAVLLGKGAY